MSFKILKVIFIILLLITIGEAGYYVYVLRSGEALNTNLATTQNTSSANSKSIPSASEQSVSPPSVPLSALTTSEYIKSNIIPYLESRKKSDNQKFYFIEEIEGQIGVIDKDPSRQLTSVLIQDASGNKVIFLTFDLSKANTTQFFSSRSGKKIAITIDDIIKGENVRLTRRVDLLNNHLETVEFEIL